MFDSCIEFSVCRSGVDFVREGGSWVGAGGASCTGGQLQLTESLLLFALGCGRFWTVAVDSTCLLVLWLCLCEVMVIVVTELVQRTFLLRQSSLWLLQYRLCGCLWWWWWWYSFFLCLKKFCFNDHDDNYRAATDHSECCIMVWNL